MKCGAMFLPVNVAHFLWGVYLVYLMGGVNSRTNLHKGANGGLGHK